MKKYLVLAMCVAATLCANVVSAAVGPPEPVVAVSTLYIHDATLPDQAVLPAAVMDLAKGKKSGGAKAKSPGGKPKAFKVKASLSAPASAVPMTTDWRT